MMLMAPALGVPNQEMLQDTLKSIIISFLALGAALVFFWQQRHQCKPIVWHGQMWFPLMLMGYAISSMLWSHAYLAGVETVRWFVFSLILWLGMNCSMEDLETRVIRGIHWGISIASLWTVLQFWLDFDLFPQGPNPASTFVNRNFFAEYAICALPFSLFLLVRAKADGRTIGLAASIGINVVALIMTGTRSALLALLILMAITPIILLRCRTQLACFQWSAPKSMVILMVLFGIVLGLGSVATGNPKLLAEFGQLSPIERATGRALSMTKADEYSSGSFSIRAVMWKATGRMIAANPLAGVGAGAWEVQAPLYQNADIQLEADYYAHNEVLQLIAEYGLIGWIFLASLSIYLIFAAWQTWWNHTPEGQRHAPLRAATLTSLLMLLIVSNAGFPWRMASTGALFALALSFMAASDAQLSLRGRFLSGEGLLTSSYSKLALGVAALCLLTAIYITQRATRSERDLIQSIKLALTITKSGKPNHPYWNDAKKDMLMLAKEGIALNPHYRKLTPMVADELANWGDWKNALWIWESILESRPNVVAIITNIARAHLTGGNLQQAQIYLEKAQRVQPNAPSVRTLEVMILSRTGQQQLASQRIKALLKEDVIDYNLVYAAYIVGERTQDWPLMIQALELRIRNWPKEAIDGWINLGNLYDQDPTVQDKDKALMAFQNALNATPEAFRDKTLKKIPATYRNQLSASMP
jgi:O-antigen ligase